MDALPGREAVVAAPWTRTALDQYSVADARNPALAQGPRLDVHARRDATNARGEPAGPGGALDLQGTESVAHAPGIRVALRAQGLFQRGTDTGHGHGAQFGLGRCGLRLGRRHHAHKDEGDRRGDGGAS